MNNFLTIILNNHKEISVIGFRTGPEEDKTIYDIFENEVRLYVPKYHLLMSYYSDCGEVRDPEIENIFDIETILERQNYVPEEGDKEKNIINREYFDDMGDHVPKGTPDVYPEVTVQMGAEDIERCLKDLLEYLEVSSIEELLQDSNNEGEEEEEAPEYIQAE